MAGRIPQRFIDELLTRVDIVEIIDSRVPLKKAGREYKACCPFHEEKTPSFTVSPSKQFYHCFGCGAHGTALGFLMEHEHMEFVEAIEHLAARMGLEIEREDDDGKPAAKPAERTTDLLTVLTKADRYYREQLRTHPAAERAIAYLKGRGLTGEVAARFGLGFAPDGWDNLIKAIGDSESERQAMLHAGLVTRRSSEGYYDRFRDRIMFPIHDHRGRIVGFGGRIMGDGEPKYLNSPETPLFHKGSELYGLHAARGILKDKNKVLVVEGYMDVVGLYQHGIDYAVATLGTATTRAHLERVFHICAEVIFCFDGDRAGRAAAWRALESLLPTLKDGRQASFLFLPEGEDPDSLVRKEGREGFEQRISVATPFSEFLMNHLTGQTDTNRMDGRARLLDLAKPLVNKIPQGALSELLRNQLANMAQTDRATVDRLIVGESRQTTRPAAGVRDGFGWNRPGSGPSPVREMISLLLHQPRLGHLAVDVEQFHELKLAGVELMIELMKTIRDHPGLNTAALLERFRGHEHHNHLEKLATRDHISDGDQLENEFRSMIARLKERLLNQQIDAVKDRIAEEQSQDGKVSESAKAQLNKLVKLKAGMSPGDS